MPARMLVVEDNPTNLELMSYLLRAFGYSHAVARDGLEAVEAALREKPDLIICDIQLPKMDGYQVVHTLKLDPTFNSVPIIAVTALAMVGDRDRVLASGFNGYIAKPIQPDTFVAEVEKYLGPEQKSNPKDRKAQGADAAGSVPRPPHRGRILVVDDVEENRLLARALLESCGYSVDTANSVGEGFEAAQTLSPDVILSDFHLTDGTGLDLLERLRNKALLREMPFMLISSSVLTSQEQTAAKRLGIRLILRPIDSERLLAEIDSLRQRPSGSIEG